MNESLSDQPCSSSSVLNVNDSFNDIDDIVLNIKDDEAEIARIGLNSSNTTEIECKSKSEDEVATTEPDDDRIPKIEFCCKACDMKEMVHYFGKAPPFVCGVKLTEDAYVLRDPFQPPPPRWKSKAEYFIVLGVNCSECQRSFCRSSECTFYYCRSFCLPCAEKNLRSFPLEVQAKLRKQLAARLLNKNK